MCLPMNRCNDRRDGWSVGDRRDFPERDEITHVAGSRVRDVDAVLRVVSEGGGTMLMKKHVDFETVRV